MGWEERFFIEAKGQEGLVAKFQLPAMGCTSKHWARARANGRWLVLSDRLIASVCSADTIARRMLGAVYDSSPGGMLHGPSALAWLGVDGYAFGLRRAFVARPRGLNGAPSQLAEIHRLRSVRPQDLIIVRGVACESALRAIWSEAARYAAPAALDLGAKKIGHLLDRAHRLDLVTWAALHESVDDLRQRGRSGTTLMRLLAETRLPGTSPTESNQETRLEELLDRNGARPLVRQPVVGGHELVGRTDHRDEDLPLVVETNSLRFHTTPSDRAADEQRYRRLTAAGFTVGVVWEDDLWSNPSGAVETVAEARRHAAAGRAVVVHSPGCPWPDPWTGEPRAPLD
jgi:hypothetical protein